MTLILIKKDNFYFRKGHYWVLEPLKGTTFEAEGQAKAFINKNLKDCKDCTVVTVKVEFKES